MAKIREATLTLKVDSRQAKQALLDFVATQKGVRVATMGTSSALKGLTGRLTAVYLGYRALGIIRRSTRDFADFEMQMANVSTMLNDQSMRYLPEYENRIRKLSISMGESTETLSKGLYDILSATIPPAEAMGVLETSARAAQAGLTSTAVAADAITTILNSYALGTEYANKVSSDLFETVQRGKTTFGELAPNIGKVAAFASQAGISLEELLATISTLTRAGLKTEIAITAVRSIISQFLKPDDKAIKAAEQLGLKLNSAQLHAIGLAGVLEMLKGQSAEFVAAIIGDMRGLAGFNAALANIEGHAYDVGYIMANSGKDVEAFGKMMSTSDKAIQRFDSTMTEVRRLLAEGWAPTLEKATNALADFVEDNRYYIRRWASDFAEGVEISLTTLSPLVQAYRALERLAEKGRAMKPPAVQGDKMSGVFQAQPGQLSMLLGGWMGDWGERRADEPTISDPLRTAEDALTAAGRAVERAKAQARNIGAGAGGPPKDPVETGDPTYATNLNTNTTRQPSAVYKQYMEDIRTEQDLLRMTNVEREKTVTVLQAMNEAKEEGQQLSLEEIANLEAEMDALERMRAIRAVGEEIGYGFARGFGQAVMYAEDLRDAMDMLKSAAVNVLEGIMEILIWQPMAEAGASFFTSLFPSAKGNVFQHGRIQAFGNGGIFPGPTVFPLGLAGEKGPEAILPLERGPDNRLGVIAHGGGNVNVSVPMEVRIINQSGTNVQAQGRPVRDGQRWILTLVAKDIQNGGMVAGAIDSRRGFAG